MSEPKPPLELVIKEENRSVGYACGACGALFLFRKGEPEEGECAAKRDEALNHCRKFCACGAALEKYYRLRCAACEGKLAAEREQKRFEAAEKVTLEDYDGPVYWNDEYYDSVDELLDHCENCEFEIPQYVWATKRCEFRIDAVELVSEQLERQEMYEDAIEDIPEQATKTLQAYLDVWCKEIDLVSFLCDTKRAVLLRPEDIAASA